MMIFTKKQGRLNSGQIVVYRRGGGVKRLYKNVIFSMFHLENTIGQVKRIIYDPNRNCPLILVKFQTGERLLFLKPKDIEINDKFVFLTSSNFGVYNEKGIRSYVKNIAVGTKIHNIVLPFETKKGNFVRSGGSFATVLSHDFNFSVIKLPSKEIRLIPNDSCATIGILDIIVKKKNAGINRRLGLRPSVRGSAKNASDHPHGGGEGKAPIGRSSPLSPWGKKTLGFKTVRKERKYILQRRK